MRSYFCGSWNSSTIVEQIFSLYEPESPLSMWPSQKWPNSMWQCVAQPSVALFATAQAGVACWVEPTNLPFLLSPQPDAAPRASARSLPSLRTLSQNLSFCNPKETWKRELTWQFCKVKEREGLLKTKVKSYFCIVVSTKKQTKNPAKEKSLESPEVDLPFRSRFKCNFFFMCKF